MTHSLPLRLALLQAPSPSGDQTAALAHLETALAAAGAAGAKMLTAPELWLPGYNHARMAEHALDPDGAWKDQLSRACLAAGCGLVVGYAERAAEGLCNAALVLDDSGQQIAHYRKIQLFGPREAALFHPGAHYVRFEFGGQTASVLICYDVEFAPHVAALARAGVKLIFVPTANMLPFTHVMRATVPAMAANHGVTIVYANYCGTEGDLTYAGNSLIVGPLGEIIAQAGATQALLITDLAEPDPALLSTQGIDLRRADWA